MIFIIIHVVKSGDTIYNLSKKYDVPVEKIIKDNQISDPQKLSIGQSLVIFPNDIIHVVKKGDSLYKIAKLYDTSISNILANNPTISNPDIIYVNQKITIPSSFKLRTIDVNGFAFEGTKAEILSNILPYMTYVSIFSYQVTPDGSLDEIYDNKVINSALSDGVQPIMVVSNTKANEGFDSDLAHVIFENQTVQENLINNIISVLNSKKYRGVNIDFEYVYEKDKNSYNQFLQKLVSKLRPLGYIVTTDLAPKTSDTQPGILYEAHDYEAQGKIVDQIILMTYEWGYLYGPPQAVSPIDQVEKVLKYAVSVIPSNKILMGMPNYGYDWTLPFVKGNSATPLTNNQAINLANQVGSQIKFDETSQTPFFEYSDEEGKQHIVWFDDARSIEAKLNLIDKYNLLGVSYWNINTYFAPNWAILNSLYKIRK